MQMEKVLEQKSVYCQQGNMIYAGKHLLVEMWQAKDIACKHKVAEILEEAVSACGATLLKTHVHIFSPYNGVSGVAILQESHITIHTWPEFAYAAIDIFVCGDVDPYKALPVFKRAFQTQQVQVVELKRGILDGKQLVF